MADYDIGAAFRAIEGDLLSSMMRNMASHRVEEVDSDKQWDMWQAKQLESLEKYKRTNRKKYKGQFSGINSSIDVLLKQSAEQGGMEQEMKILNKIKKRYGNSVPAKFRRMMDSVSSRFPVLGNRVDKDFFQTTSGKIDSLIKATTADMTKAEHAMLRMADDQYRKIIFNAQMYAASGASTYAKAVDMASRDCISKGINCIQYKDGKLVNIKSYAAMAVRTAQKRATLYAEGEVRKQLGISTVIVKKRMNACPKCLPFIDKILIDDVWSGGKAADGPYPLVSSAIAAGFLHPNCKDHLSTYIEGLTDPPEGGFTQEELQVAEYEASQDARQQYAERQAESFARLAEYSLDSENKRVYQSRAEEWKRQVAGLSLEEEGAITRYVSPDSYVLNDKLRRNESLTDAEKDWIIKLNKALDKLPCYEGDLNRSLTFAYDEDAKEFFDSLSSESGYEPKQYFSTTKQGVYNNIAQVQIFIQNTKHGRDLGFMNDMEGEVLYPLGSEFKILNKVKKDGKYYVLLEEA